MIPSRKPSPEKSNRIQLNRYFDSEAEMIQFVKQNYPDAVIKRFWPVQVLACIIETEEKKQKSSGQKF